MKTMSMLRPMPLASVIHNMHGKLYGGSFDVDSRQELLHLDQLMLRRLSKLRLLMLKIQDLLPHRWW